MWEIIHNERVNEILTARGYNVYSVREPGGVPISESIRNIIMDNKNTDMDDRCEALLFAAAELNWFIPN